MTIAPIRRRLPTFLLAAGGMALGAPALAQTTPEPLPVRIQADGNGVDMATGAFTMSATDVSIGPAGTGLAYARVWSGSGWRGTTLGTICVDPTDSSLYIVSMGAGSETFELTGSLATGTFASQLGSGATLTYNSSTQKFTYTSADGTRAVFDGALAGKVDPTNADQGVLTQTIAPNGAKTTYHYNEATVSTTTRARIQSVTNSFGYQLHFTYADDSPANVTELNGAWLRPLKVTGINNAVEFCGPTANTCTFTKDWPTAEYDGTAEHAAVTSVETYFDDAVASRTTTYTYTGGKIDKVRFDGFTTDHIDVNYDGNNRVSTINRGFATWTYTYSEDTVGKTLTTTINVPGATNHEVIVATTDTKLVTSFRNTALQTTTYTYDLNQRITKVEAPESNATHYSYDARGNVITVTMTDKATSALSDLVTSATYQASCANPVICNKPTSTTDRLGKVTDYAYDATHGGLLWSKAPDPDGAGALPRPETRIFYVQKTARYYVAVGNTDPGPSTWLVAESATCASSAFSGPYNASAGNANNNCTGGDADKTVSEPAWPAAGTPNNLQPLSVTAKSGNAVISTTTSFTYDDYGRSDYIDGPLAGNSDRVRTIYDSLGRPAGSISPDPDGAGALKHPATRTTYNALGLVESVEQGTVNGYTDTDWAAFVSLQKGSTKYDAYGRPIVSYVYEGATTTIGALAQTKYDSAGRADCTVTRMNPSLFSSIVAAPGSYDPCDSPTTTGAFGRDRVTKLVYEAATGRLQKTTAAYDTPLAQDSATQTYTDNGLVASVTDAKGNKTSYAYDGFDRLTKTCFPSKTTAGTVSTTDCEQLFYNDTPARRGLLDKVRPRIGHIASSAAHDISFTYDDLGRVTRRHVPGSADGTASKENYDFTYDNFGRVKTAYHYHLTLAYSYDALGRLTKKQHNSVNPIDYAYDAAGRLTQLSYPDGWDADYTYDTLGRPKTVKNGAATLASVSYDDLGRRYYVAFGNGTGQTTTFDGLGRLDALTNNLNGTAGDRNMTFDYNPASQLTDQTDWNSAFDFAAPGADYSDTYAANGLNQYTNVAGTTSVVYDGSGNITTDHRGRTYTYDAENRLRTVTDTGLSVTYIDDAHGNMRWRNHGGAVSHHYYDGGQEIYEGSGSFPGTLTRRYVRIPGSVDEAFLMIDYTGACGASGCYSYAHTDARGSVVATSDASGDLDDTYTYSDFGESGAEGDSGFPFRFTGQKLDAATGLYYYKARWYDPETGRFLQTDPIGYGDGMNMYAYVGNDPVNATDPTGMTCFTAHTSGGGSCGNGGGGGGGGYKPRDEVFVNGVRPNPFGGFGDQYGWMDWLEDFYAQGPYGSLGPAGPCEGGLSFDSSAFDDCGGTIVDDEEEIEEETCIEDNAGQPLCVPNSDDNNPFRQGYNPGLEIFEAVVNTDYCALGQDMAYYGHLANLGGTFVSLSATLGGFSSAPVSITAGVVAQGGAATRFAGERLQILACNW